MSNISGLSGATAPANAYKAPRTNQISQTQQTQMSEKKTADDVLASLREMMPGWTISTTTSDWGEGFKNIQIDREILDRMANDPAEMKRVSSMIQGFESAVPELEKWQEQNPGQSLVLSLMLDEHGNTTGTATIKTLLGAESNTTFDPSEPSWLENLMKQLNTPVQGQSWTV